MFWLRFPLHVDVQLNPKARHNRIEGVVADAEGDALLKISVTAAPEDGKANAALIRLLAREWGLPKGRIALVRGEKSRRKRLHMAGPAEALATQLDAWLKTHHG
ncbi:MAG: DUF167 domain-containing protein [Alphaproteobacteria bacterium]|nr:DUF167 domain-containing protein [Alphaproteobacteria bacterium]